MSMIPSDISNCPSAPPPTIGKSACFPPKEPKPHAASLHAPKRRFTTPKPTPNLVHGTPQVLAALNTASSNPQAASEYYGPMPCPPVNIVITSEVKGHKSEPHRHSKAAPRRMHCAPTEMPAAQDGRGVTGDPEALLDEQWWQQVQERMKHDRAAQQVIASDILAIRQALQVLDATTKTFEQNPGQLSDPCIATSKKLTVQDAQLALGTSVSPSESHIPAMHDSQVLLDGRAKQGGGEPQVFDPNVPLSVDGRPTGRQFAAEEEGQMEEMNSNLNGASTTMAGQNKVQAEEQIKPLQPVASVKPSLEDDSDGPSTPEDSPRTTQMTASVMSYNSDDEKGSPRSPRHVAYHRTRGPAVKLHREPDLGTKAKPPKPVPPLDFSCITTIEDSTQTSTPLYNKEASSQPRVDAVKSSSLLASCPPVRTVQVISPKKDPIEGNPLPVRVGQFRHSSFRTDPSLPSIVVAPPQQWDEIQRSSSSSSSSSDHQRLEGATLASHLLNCLDHDSMLRAKFGQLLLGIWALGKNSDDDEEVLHALTSPISDDAFMQILSKIDQAADEAKQLNSIPSPTVHPSVSTEALRFQNSMDPDAAPSGPSAQTQQPKVSHLAPTLFLPEHDFHRRCSTSSIRSQSSYSERSGSTSSIPSFRPSNSVRRHTISDPVSSPMAMPSGTTKSASSLWAMVRRAFEVKSFQVLHLCDQLTKFLDDFIFNVYSHFLVHSDPLPVSMPASLHRNFGKQFAEVLSTLKMGTGSDKELVVTKPRLTMPLLRYELTAWRIAVCKPMLDAKRQMFRSATFGAPPAKYTPPETSSFCRANTEVYSPT